MSLIAYLGPSQDPTCLLQDNACGRRYNCDAQLISAVWHSPMPVPDAGPRCQSIPELSRAGSYVWYTLRRLKYWHKAADVTGMNTASIQLGFLPLVSRVLPAALCACIGTLHRQGPAGPCEGFPYEQSKRLNII